MQSDRTFWTDSRLRLAGLVDATEVEGLSIR